MESILQSRVLRIKKIERYLTDKNIKLGKTTKQTKEIFIDHILTKNKTRIKRRSRIRRKLLRK
tara:strand:- start:658 stop:846 length:189 start_codon:yes stop_codon:yes gene_type:complete